MKVVGENFAVNYLEDKEIFQTSKKYTGATSS